MKYALTNSRNPLITLTLVARLEETDKIHTIEKCEIVHILGIFNTLDMTIIGILGGKPGKPDHQRKAKRWLIYRSTTNEISQKAGEEIGLGIKTKKAEDITAVQPFG